MPQHKPAAATPARPQKPFKKTTLALAAVLLSVFLASPPALAAEKAKTEKATQTKSAPKKAAAPAKKAATKPAAKKTAKPPAKKPEKKADASPLDGDWQKTFALIRDTKDPIAQKLVVWFYASETNVPSEPRALMRFVEDNPGWPRLFAVRRKIESVIGDSALTPAETATWFDTYPPLSYDGARAYINALLALQQNTRARAALDDFWMKATLSRNETASLVAAYKPLFGRGAMAKRLDAMLWSDRQAEAETMLAFVDPDTQALGYARLALARQAPDANSALAKVPASLQGDEGLMFERMKYRRRKDPGDSALEVLDAFKGQQAHPEKWWPEIHIMARRAIEKGDYRRAYAIATHHQLTEGAEFAGAEWMLGWLKLEHLNDPVMAYRHFDRLYRGVGSAVSRSRAAYWAARTSERLKEMPTAQQWHNIAAYYPSTFYGQLSYIALHGRPDAKAFAEEKPDAATTAAFDRGELVRAIRLLSKVGLIRLADPFFSKLLAQATTRADFELIAKLAHDTNRLYYAVEANKQMQQDLGGFMFDQGYPLLSFKTPAEPERALIHAIIYRESMYDPQIQSAAGARGLMQLMPGTAQHIAKKQGRDYKTDYLTDNPRYNVDIGSAYLASLVDQYNGYYPMAIAAYNAGPSRVAQWIALYGDPRDGRIDPLDWVEHIPIYETRNYVQRVLETYFIYKVKMGQPARTILDFAPAAR